MTLNNFRWNKWLVTALRMAIGWHFLFEGFSKLMVPGWTSYQYLMNTTGFTSGFFHWLASDPAVVKVVDFLNVWGLILIGLGLAFGVLIRVAALSGVALLALYYFAYPPFGASVFRSSEGQFYIVDRNFIEALILIILCVLNERGYGIGNLWPLLFRKKQAPEVTPLTTDPYADPDEVTSGLTDPQPEPAPVALPDTSRREVLKNLISLPVLGAMGWGASQMHRRFGIDTLSSATIQLKTSDLRKLEGDLPKGKLGKFEMSRLVMGGNLIGGWAHARDLIYVSSLFRAYNTERKIFETLMLCEEAGINTINIGYASSQLLAKYKKLTGSKMTVITQVAPNKDPKLIFEQINGATDAGSDILQVQGNWCDWLCRDQKTEVIVQMLDKIRSQGMVAGLGAHTIDSFLICEEQGIIPDYYMKTMHHDNYWSAHPRENRKAFEVDGKKSLDHNQFHDNCFCPFPDRTIEFVNRTKVPVMGFKVLAAGALKPEDGFKWAFENGADFICVGMFDFQVVDDVNVTIKVLKELSNRQREWFA